MAIGCPSEADLQAFHLGSLPPDAVEAVAGHLETCPGCAAAVERLEAVPDPLVLVLRKQVPALPSPTESAPTKRLLLPPARPEDYPRLPGYEVMAPLGSGGMGVVYKARQVGLNRLVALKQLRAGDARALARARTEAEALARLQHPHIVQIHEVIEHEGRVYLALELVEGGALGARLTGKPQAPRDSAALVETLARAVHYAHGHGVVHRDLKPGNVLLAAESGAGASFGIPKVADFGLAKLLAEDTGQTRDGDVMGTPCYMAPEQAAGKIRDIGPATDVYSLGIILYEMITGRVPFQGPSTLDTLIQVRSADPVPPRRLQPRVPRDLETICLKCLQKEPHRRYASAADLADDLGWFVAGQPIRARPIAAWERAWKWARRRPAVATLSATIVLVVAAALVLVSWQWRQAEVRRQQAEVAEARLALGQGHALCEQGDIGRGLLWLARSLERATSAGATDLDRPLRINLAAWGRQLRPPGPILPNPAHVLGLAFDGTGSQLLAAGKDGLVHCWDVESGREVAPALEAPGTPQRSWTGPVAFSPDGRTIAAACNDRVALWDAASHRHLGAPLPHVPGKIWGMAFLRDGRLATCDAEGAARVWDLARRRVVVGPLRNAQFGKGYYTLDISPDERTLVIAGEAGQALRWDLASGRAVLPAFQHDSLVLAAVFSPDGRRLITSTRGGTLHAWDLGAGRSIDLPRQATEVTHVAFSPDGRRFATSTGFGVVRLWHADSLRPVGPVYRCPSGVHSLAFSPNGRSLAMGMREGGIALVELPPSLEAAPPTALGPGADVHAVCYTPDGERLLAGTRFGARWLESATGRPLRDFLSNPEQMSVEGTALSPDGTSVAMGRWSGVLGAFRGRAELWEAASGQRRWQSPDQPAPVATVAYSPDGRTLFSCGRPDHPGGGALWDTATGDCVRPLLAALGPVRVRAAVFHPVERGVLLACDDGRARLWDVNADCEIDADRPLEHASAVTAVAFNAAGGRALTGCRDGTAQLWDLRTRTLLLEPLRQEAEVSSVAFSPDGLTLLTGALDGTARFWDAGSGQPLGPTLWHPAGVNAVAFHPSGQRVATGDKASTVYQWHVPVPPLEGSPERVRQWAEAVSGLALDEQGAVHALPAAEVAERRRRLAAEGPLTAPGS